MTDGALLEAAMLGRPAALEVNARVNPIVLVIPWGKRSIRLKLPIDVAAFLRDELSRALGGSCAPEAAAAGATAARPMDQHQRKENSR